MIVENGSCVTLAGIFKTTDPVMYQVRLDSVILVEQQETGDPEVKTYRVHLSNGQAFYILRTEYVKLCTALGWAPIGEA